MMRFGQHRRLPRARTFWWMDGETIGSTIGVMLFMVAVLWLCGAFPRGIADVHFTIVTVQR
jgi:hypothetical protein